MKRLHAVLALCAVPALMTSVDASPFVPHRVDEAEPKKLEVDQVFFVQGSVTFPPPIGTIQVDLKVTTCKQGTSGCP